MHSCTKPLHASAKQLQNNKVSCTKETARPQLPERVTRARVLKRAGLAGSATLVAGSVLLAGAKGIPIPEVAGWIPWGAAAALIAPLAALAVSKAVLGDKLEVELHNGRLYVQWDVPSADAPALMEGAVQVRPSDGKGNGAFAALDIPGGTYLGDYEGELIHEADYWDRYPSGVADYCMGIDREWTIDGCERAKNTSRFSPCHMNHSSTRYNVVRRCCRRDRQVSFYTARAIKAGEELLLDYGWLYWQGRRDKIID